MNRSVETVLARLQKVKRTRGGYIALCPAHEDHNPSLSVTPKPDGVLLHCFAGCDPAVIAEALGLKMSDLFDDHFVHSSFIAQHSTPVATYDYRDEEGKLLFQVVRFEPKAFRQRRPALRQAQHDGKGEWIWNLKGVRLVPFRLPQILDAARAGEHVFVAEGEKDVHTLLSLGLVATTNPGGAGKWKKSYSRCFEGANVVILPDNDPPGLEHARHVARSLTGHAKSVKLVMLPGLPEKGDVSDWVALGHTKEELHALVEKTPEWTPTLDSPQPTADSLLHSTIDVQHSTSHSASPPRLFTLEQLLCGDAEEVSWTVEGLVPEGGITVFGGDSGVGKSWAAYHLGLCAAGGVPLFEKFPTSRRGVLIFDAESAIPLCRRRVQRLFAGLAAQGHSLPSDLPFRVYLGPLRIRDSAEADKLAQYLAREGIGLVIADPLIHCLPQGTSENDSVSMAKFFENVRRVQSKTGAAFVFCHHSRKRSNLNPSDAGQMLRGSSAIRGVLDSHIFLRKLRTGLLLAEHDKSRHAEALPNFTIEIADPDSDSTTVRFGGETAETGEQTAVASAFILRALTDAGGSLTRKHLLEQAKSEGLTQRTVDRVLREGVDAGTLTRQRQGNGVVYSLTAHPELLWSED